MSHITSSPVIQRNFRTDNWYLYLIGGHRIFSVLLLAFEFRLYNPYFIDAKLLCLILYFRKKFDKFVANNFGFMFNFTGRSIFLAFLGSMVINLRPASLAYPIGIFTFVVLFINAFILCASPGTAQYLASANKPVIHKVSAVKNPIFDLILKYRFLLSTLPMF